MRIRFAACPHGTWEIATAQPALPKERGIFAYRGYRTELSRPRRRLSSPMGGVSLVLAFDEGLPMRLTRATAPGAAPTPLTSVLTGLTTESWLCDIRDKTHGIEVVLAPWAAFALCDIAMHDLSGRAVPPGELLGRRIGLLTAHLAELPEWSQRFIVLDEVLAQWIARGRPWSPRVVWACAELVRTAGRMPVRILAETVGWSPRQLEYRFLEQVGITPKAMARLYRLRRTIRLLATGRLPAETVVPCGFSDQAHLTREFKSMIGVTPGRFRAAVLHTGQALPDRIGRSIRSVVLDA